MDFSKEFILTIIIEVALFILTLIFTLWISNTPLISPFWLAIATSALISIFFVTSAFALGYFFFKKPQAGSSIALSEKTRAVIIVVLAIVLAVCLAIVLMPKGAPILSITDPSNGDTVSKLTYIKGTSQNLGGQQIYVAIYHVDRYYPIGETVSLNANGKWSVLYDFANEPKGTPLELVALLANQDAQNKIERYLQVSRDTGSWHGLSELPKGATRYDSVTVIQG